MSGGARVLALVPARGGSDPVPFLNIKRLGDAPLLAHTLRAARGADGTREGQQNPPRVARTLLTK